MEMTRRLKDFVREVAKVAISEKDSDVTYDECIAEYTDQIVTDDYFSVAYYADYKGIAIPRALKGILKTAE